MNTVLPAPDLLNEKTFADGPPHHIFDRLRAEEPVYGQQNPLGQGTVWSLTRFADIRDIQLAPDRFTITRGHQFPTPASHAQAMRDNIIYNDPPRHTRLRSFAAKAFSPAVVARFEGWIRELCDQIIDNVLKHDRFDMIPMIAAELPGQVICSIMGVPDRDRHNLIGWATDIFGRMDPDIGVAKALAGVATVKQYARELRVLKEREPGVDMTTELLSASFNSQPITDGEFIDMVTALVLAGFETTHTLIAQTLVLIASDPDVRRQVEEAPAGTMSNFADEFLRIISPVMHMTRTATEDVELHGKSIKKDDTVVMWFSAANRDPEVFPDPHLFIGARGRRGHAAFGTAGPHMCIGNHLARLEAVILLDEMRKRGVRLDLDGEPERARGIFINALRKVPMRVVR